MSFSKAFLKDAIIMSRVPIGPNPEGVKVKKKRLSLVAKLWVLLRMKKAANSRTLHVVYPPLSRWR